VAELRASGYNEEVRLTRIELGVRSVLAGVLGATVVSVSAGAAPISPADGATVTGRPSFAFDFAEGYVSIEFSRSPETTSSGADPGKFVDDSRFLFEPVKNGGLAWPIDQRALSAGVVYWHLKESAAPTYQEQPWSRTMRLRVNDEPPIVAGWLVRTRRLPKTRTCRRRVGFAGTFVHSDNHAASERLDWFLSVLGAGKPSTPRVLRGQVTYDGDGFERTEQFAGVVCALRTRLTVVLKLRDAAGHTASSAAKSVRVP
jgi:hypothetical protein